MKIFLVPLIFLSLTVTSQAQITGISYPLVFRESAHILRPFYLSAFYTQRIISTKHRSFPELYGSFTYGRINSIWEIGVNYFTRLTVSGSYAAYPGLMAGVSFIPSIFKGLYFGGTLRVFKAGWQIGHYSTKIISILPFFQYQLFAGKFSGNESFTFPAFFILKAGIALDLSGFIRFRKKKMSSPAE